MRCLELVPVLSAELGQPEHSRDRRLREGCDARKSRRPTSNARLQLFLRPERPQSERIHANELTRVCRRLALLSIPAAKRPGYDGTGRRTPPAGRSPAV